jgi:hypothetical protein
LAVWEKVAWGTGYFKASCPYQFTVIGMRSSTATNFPDMEELCMKEQIYSYCSVAHAGFNSTYDLNFYLFQHLAMACGA